MKKSNLLRKKSNKITLIYVISSIVLWLLLIGGGIYGIYLSVGLSFVRNGVSNITDGSAMNVSYGGAVNISNSMIGVTILSVALIVISILDIVSLIRQIVLFKQFKMIRESNIEKSIEKKVKSKTKVVVFAVFVDIISFACGVIGILVNMRCFPAGSMCWGLYLIDGLVAILSVASIVLLILKYKKVKKINELNLDSDDLFYIDDNKNENSNESENKKSLESQDSKIEININSTPKSKEIDGLNSNENLDSDDEDIEDELEEENDKDLNESMEETLDFNIDEMEYKLLKLRQLKTTRMITEKEYDYLRSTILGTNEIFFNNNYDKSKGKNNQDEANNNIDN